MDNPPHFVTPDQLRVGMYIHLDRGWMDHPFTFSNFKIKTEEQLAQIRSMGLKKLRYDPLRSDAEPLPAKVEQAEPARPVVTEEPAISAESAEIPAESVQVDLQQQRLEALHQAMHECEKKFAHASGEARRIEREIYNNPPKTLDDARSLVNDMVDSLLTESDVALHAMQQDSGVAEQYIHSLNVTVLSLILAKSMDISAEDGQSLGLGSLLHDVGKSRIPDRIILKTDPLTRAETSLVQQHPEFGNEFAKDHKMPTAVLHIILQHHESIDGSGYPGHLKQDQIDPLARIVAVANTYENLCNPVNPADAMTPYEALAHMFSKLRSKFDAGILKLLIKSLGVYPPGSIVQLSDGRYGIVASVNPSKPLRPYVLMYAPEVPRDRPLLINLGDEAGLSISRCLRQNALPKDVLNYLAPGKRICYFFQKEHAEQEPPPAQ
jgi:putative nucleotidyltransferase with HDIG domain